jgi:very-short-patch-repair endonuclease
MRRFPFIFREVPPAPTRSVKASPIERAFWLSYQRIKPKALHGLTPQYRVGAYRLDFAIPSSMIGIELDGYQSHSSTVDIAKDHARERYLQERGWYIIRFGGLEIYRDSDSCVRQAARIVQRIRSAR